MAPKRKAAVAATKRIRGEKPALRADVQEPPKKKRKVTKVATRNVRQKKAAKNVPKDMVDDPEKLVRKERWVWEPSEQPARRSPSYDKMRMLGCYGFHTIRDSFGEGWETRRHWWRPRNQWHNDFAVADDDSGPELERVPPRARAKILEAKALSVNPRFGMTACAHLPTSWKGSFDLYPTDANTKAPDELDVLQWQLEQQDAPDTMRLSLGPNADPLAQDGDLETGKDSAPPTGMLCGLPLSVGEVEETIRSCGVANAQDVVLPWSKDARSVDSIPLVVTHGYISKLTFRTLPSYSWGIDDGYIAKLQFPGKSSTLYDNDQVAIIGEGGIKLRKVWQLDDTDGVDGPRLRELFAGHLEFTVAVKNKKEPQEFVSKTVRRNFYGIRSKASRSLEYPAFLGLPQPLLQSILPPPYNGSTPAIPIPSSLTPTPDQPPPPLDFSGNFWFAFPHNKGFQHDNSAAIHACCDVHMREVGLLVYYMQEMPEETGGPAANLPLEHICPDPKKLERAYERVHAELMWTIDNSKLCWLDGHIVLEEGALGRSLGRDYRPPGSDEPVARLAGVGMRGKFSLGVDPTSKYSLNLKKILHSGLEVTDGHVGPVHFPLHQRTGYNVLRSSYDRNTDIDIPDPQPETRWEHGLQVCLQLARSDDDGPEDAPRRMRGQGTLKMRRVWAYTFPGNDAYGAMHGELFEGWYEFELYDKKQATYERANDTFFAVRWRDGEEAEGKRDLAGQKLGYARRVERWRGQQIAEPFEEGPVAWELDKAPTTFHCYRDKMEESDWSLQEPPPSMDNFFKWLGTRTGEEQELDWEFPPEPDPKKPRTNGKVKCIVRTPEERSSASSVDETIPWPRFDSRANS